MFHVVFQDQSTGLIECCSGRTDLNQNLAVILPFSTIVHMLLTWPSILARRLMTLLFR